MVCVCVCVVCVCLRVSVCFYVLNPPTPSSRSLTHPRSRRDMVWGVYEELVRRCGGYTSRARGSLPFCQLVSPNDEAFFRTIFYRLLNALPFGEDDRDDVIKKMKHYGARVCVCDV